MAEFQGEFRVNELLRLGEGEMDFPKYKNFIVVIYCITKNMASTTDVLQSIDNTVRDAKM
jgi:hypothetical protein